MTATSIRELRDSIGETQKAFAERFHIPLSTLRKWEQGTASPPEYVLELIAESLPVRKEEFHRLGGNGEEIYYYDPMRRLVSDRFGNLIRIREDPTKVNEHNLGLYLHDLYESYYQAVDRFNRDCRLDQEEHIIWS